MKTESETAETLDDLQDAERRSRQVIIEAVKLAWEEWMVPEGQHLPHADNARQKVDQILAARAPRPK